MGKANKNGKGIHFKRRRVTIRRPASGICQFCLKVISRANWSRHMHQMHEKAINDIYKEEEESFDEAKEEMVLLSSPEKSPTKLGLTTDDGDAEDKQTANKQQREMQDQIIMANDDDKDSEQNIKKDHEATDEGLFEEQQQIPVETTEDTSLDEAIQQEKPPLRRSKRNAAKRIWTLIKLPATNICPLCDRKTSQGNWSRHLRRHHPEYVPGSNDEESLPKKAADTPTVDLPLLQLEQFLAQQIQQHNDLNLFGMDKNNKDGEEKEEKPDQAMGEEEAELFSNGMESQGNGITERKRALPEQGTSGNGGEKTLKIEELFPERRIIMRRPTDGICQFCLKTISASNWSRHLRSIHADDILKSFKMRAEDCQVPVNFEKDGEWTHADGTSSSTDEPTLMGIAADLAIKTEHAETEFQKSEFSLVVVEGQQLSISDTGPIEAAKEQQPEHRKRDRNNEKKVLVKKSKSAIKLPKSNICPVCEKKTSQGNWSRHLKRHHPEYALKSEDDDEHGEEAQSPAALFVISTEEVRSFVIRCMQSVQTSFAHAVQLAELLLDADLSGHHNHGLRRLSDYVAEMASGLRGEGEPKVLKQKGATAWVDGSNLLGAVVGNFCTDLAIKLAREHGIGWVLANNCSHFGVGQHYAKRIAQVGMVGISFVSSPNGGPKIPICCCANSARSGDSFLLDNTADVEANVELENSHQQDNNLPSTSSAANLQGIVSPNGELLPFSASNQSHAGIGMMFQVLSGVLGGALLGQNVAKEPGNLTHCFLAIDPECFGGSSPDFGTRLQFFLDHSKGADGLPGDVERMNAEKSHIVGGLVYGEDQIRALKQLALKCRVHMFAYKPKQHVQ